MTMAAPDWYTDPSNSGFQRWWTGQGWSDYTRPSPNPAAYPAAQEESPKTARQRDKMVRRRNGFGWAGAALAIISVMIDPYGLVAVLAIVFSSIGVYTATKLRETGSPVTGLGWSVAGLVVGILTGVFALFVVARVVSSMWGPQL